MNFIKKPALSKFLITLFFPNLYILVLVSFLMVAFYVDSITKTNGNDKHESN